MLPLDVKVGDRVLFGKYSGQTVKVQGEELLVMREEDIMGVVEQAKSAIPAYSGDSTCQQKTSNSTNRHGTRSSPA